MTDKPPKDEPGADERFERGVANALNMPAKPHKPKGPEDDASKRGRDSSRRRGI